MDFKPFHNEYFNAKVGAFSKVTDREYYDSQITLTGSESQIVLDYFGIKSIQVGKVKDNKVKSSKTFKHYNSGNSIQLNLNYPKADKPELRLYIGKTKGFKPPAGEIWFVFISNLNEIVIGSKKENEWNEIGQEDTEDTNYLAEINTVLSSSSKIAKKPEGDIKTIMINSRESFLRNPIIAAYRFQLSKFKCEIDPTHRTFTSQKTMRPYVEAHHFIPIKYQRHFKAPLDTVENVISLCPNCHRAIHYAIIDERIELINKVYRVRPKIYGLSEEEIAEAFYNCIKL
jgi:predicted HNH restriction endonuclease